jgi:hypothetical protein
MVFLQSKRTRPLPKLKALDLPVHYDLYDKAEYVEWRSMPMQCECILVDSTRIWAEIKRANIAGREANMWRRIRFMDPNG